MLHNIELQKYPPLRRTFHTNMWNMSKASPEYLTSSTEEITVVLLLEGGGDYHCIGLLEVVWKVVTVILNL